MTARITMAEYLARREYALDLLAYWGDRIRTKHAGLAVRYGTWPAAAWAHACDRYDAMTRWGHEIAGVPPRDRTPLPLPGGAP